MKLDELRSHGKLKAHLADLEPLSMRQLFDEDSARFDRYSVQGPQVFLDYSKNRITDETLELLLQLADEIGLKDRIQALVSGQKINVTENRPALHTALRMPATKEVRLHNTNIIDEVHATRRRMNELVTRIHAGDYRGATGKPIKTLVSIGIGGSYLGPKMVTEALKSYRMKGYEVHYIANIDGTDLVETLANVDPESTLFLIQSKSFSTLETLENAKAVRAWLEAQGIETEATGKHFIAVSANTDAAVAFGIDASSVFPMWDWVGGRYSLWSAIGFPIAFLLGMDQFEQLLQGAYEMDCHFEEAPFAENLPVLMGLLGVLYNNYFEFTSQAILPYDEYLQYLPDHLQQLDMESNGKSVDCEGQHLNYNTGPVIWGGAGTNGQHAYHQLLHQGTLPVPADFIIPLETLNPVAEHHKHLFSNCISQSQALMRGKTETEAAAELRQAGHDEEMIKRLAPHKVIPGNRPSNTLILKKLTPASLGALIALYEHKVFVQGSVWGINSFDQWGVELGKELSTRITHSLETGEMPDNVDASTQGLVEKFRT